VQGGSADRGAGGVAHARRRLLVELDHGARRRAHVYVKDAAEAMHALAFGQESCSLSEYIDWAVDQARRMNEIDLAVEGDTDDEKAQSLVRAMLAAGLAEKL